MQAGTSSQPYIHRFRPPQGDNYQYLLIADRHCLVVDPYDENNVIAELARLDVRPAGVLITHTHWDHVNGLAGFLHAYPVPVHVHPAGAADVAGQTVPLADGGEIAFTDTVVYVRHAPGHHPAHVLFAWQGYLVVGDLLFLAGCGNPNFGGNVEQLYASIWDLLRAFDPTLLVAWGHDYADKNLRFAAEVEPGNAAIGVLAEAIRAARGRGDDVPWRSLGDERATNPFLRCDQAAIIATAMRHGAKSSTPYDVFVTLRRIRDTF